MYWQRFFRFVLDQLFPRACLGCGKEGVDVCAACLAKLPLSPLWQDVEGLPVWSAYEYHTKNLERYIQAWKYHGSRHFVDAWLLFVPFPEAEYDVIVPVPLHKRRFLERGFNQAEQMASCLAERVGLPMVLALRRCRYTKPQAQCSGEERRINVRDVFAADRALVDRVHGKRVLLIDDVVTTGSTVLACAKSLKEAGAASVEAWCLARGGSGDQRANPAVQK